MAHFDSVDEYINSFDGITKERLQAMRALVKKALPDAEERISYDIPAYFVDKKMIMYFAGYAGHVGVYPGRTNSAAYNQVAGKHASGKSTLRFPHDEPLPEDLIKKFIEIRLDEVNK